MNKYLMIAAGGAAGASLRYLLSGLTYRFMSDGFPWGTLLVNMVGCLTIGMLWALSERSLLVSKFHPLLFTGILGGFTTFSAFGLETFQLVQAGEYRLGFLNGVLSPVLGLCLVFVGYAATQLLIDARG